jgi:hypothetical protein
VTKPIEKVFQDQEKAKKREYNTRINQVEHATFTPMVFCSTGGASKEAMVVLKKLSSAIAEKTNQSYAKCLSLLRVRLAFDLMRSAVMMLRGSRRRRAGPIELRQADVVIHEARIELE